MLENFPQFCSLQIFEGEHANTWFVAEAGVERFLPHAFNESIAVLSLISVLGQQLAPGPRDPNAPHRVAS